jgi:hypothetical protein
MGYDYGEFVREFDQWHVDEIIERYEIGENDDRSLVPSAAELVLTWEDSTGYDGSYSELFVKNGVLYENESGHCSCYGCEGQWEPDQITLSMIARRPDGFRGMDIAEVTALARARGYTGE